MNRFLLPIQSFLLAIALTWPAAAVLRTAAIGSVDGDGAKHVWTLWWMREEMWHGRPGLQTDWVNFPDGMDLYPIEPLNGLFAILWPGDPVTLSNILAILHVTLLGIFSGWLGKLVSKNDWGGHISGALAQGSAFAAFTLHVGVGELRQYWWIPLGLGCLVKARERLEWRWFFALAFALIGSVLSCFYHGLFLATAVALYALATIRPIPKLLLGYFLAAELSIAVTLPIVKSFSSNYGGESAPQPIFAPDGTVQATYKGSAMELQELVTPRRGLRATADRQTVTYTGGRYLGIAALALLGVAVFVSPRRAMPWLVVIAGCTLLSLGSVLWVNGRIVELNGKPVVLPLAWINDALRNFAEPLNFPARFIAPAMIALAAVASLASRWRWSVLLVPIALVEVTYNELVPWPRAWFVLPSMEGLEAGEGAVADIRIALNSDTEARNLDISAQLELSKAFQAVPIERQDKWAPTGNRWLVALPLVSALEATWRGRAASYPTDPREDQYLLRQRGFDRVLVTHRAAEPERELRDAIERSFGKPVSTSKHGTLYAVPLPEATDAERAAWREAQEKRLERMSPTSFGPQYPSGTNEPHRQP